MTMNLNMFKLSIILLIFYLRHISITKSAACASLTNAVDCGNSPSCEWNDALSQKCYCTSNTPLDVVFVLDESGSVGYTNFQTQKAWIASMIREGLSRDSKVHVLTFGSNVKTHYTFWEDQSSKENIALAVEAIGYPRGVTRMDLAVQHVRDVVFPTWHTKTISNNPLSYFTDNKPLLVFLTDGRPCCYTYATPCPDVASLHQVVPDVLVVGIGSGWTLSSVQCMVTKDYPIGVTYDPDRIISVPRWDPDDFAAAKILTESFLCPEDVSFKVTEIRIEQYQNGGITHHSRFVEFYNPDSGEDIDLTKVNLIFEGFMDSTQFGFGAVGSCTTVIEAGKYVVFYDPTMDTPVCGGCSCTMTGGQLQCDDALYIPCDANAATSGCGSCTWNDTMDNDFWSQAVYDYAGRFELSSVTRPRNDSEWLFIAYTGYSTELKGVGYTESEPDSWQPSCNYTGTPGQEPLPLPCATDCRPDICQSQGDNNATCANPEYDTCDCSEAESYYYSPNGYCTKLLPPTDCTVTNIKQDGFGIYATIEWKINTQNYESGTYFNIYIDGDRNTAVGSSLYSEDIRQDSTVYVKAAFDEDVSGITVESELANCPVFTVPPTKEPTPDPTQGNADVPYCNGKIFDYNLISLTWGEGEKGEPTDIDGPYTYYIYGHIIPGDDSTAFVRTATTKNIDINLNDNDLKLTLDIASNGWPEIYVVTEYRTVDYTGGLTPADIAVMKGPTGGKAECILSTKAPTDAPTSDPTKDPTEDPTSDPTDYPTPAPSYAEPTLEDCRIDIPGKYEQDRGQPIVVYYTVDVPSDAGPKPTIQFSAASISTDQIVNDRGVMIVALSDDVIINAITATNDGDDQNSFKARITYQTYPDTTIARANGPYVICDYDTSSPTPAPTDDPTKDPTIDPTSDPTLDPTTDPTEMPTPAPTFQLLSLPDACIAEMNSAGTEFTIVFTETTFDDEDPGQIYPLSSDINYEIRIGDLKSNADVVETLSASQSGATVRYPINDRVNPNQFVVDSSKITVDITRIDLSDRSNLPIECHITTQSPTSSPTTPEPTSHPVVDNPIVRFEVVSGYNTDEDGIETPIFTDWGTDGECVLPQEPIRRRQMETMRRLLQGNAPSPTQAPSVAVLVNDCTFCPVCPVKENSDVKYLRLIRDPPGFPYDVLVRLTMTHLLNTAGEGIDKKDFDLKAIDANEPNDLNLEKNNKLDKFFSKEKNNFLAFYIMGGDDNPTGRVEIPYYLTVDDIEDSDEAFEVSIRDCEVASENMPNLPPDALKDYYTCSSGLYYPTVIVQVTDADKGDSFTSTSEGELPLWIWAPVGFAAVAIPILAYLIYRFYQGKKRADAMEKQRKHELEEHAKMDDIGEFGTIGDNVRANPLATGDAFEIPKGDEAIAHQLTMDKMQFEPATVDVEHNVFKQDFGPVQAEKHMSMDQLLDDNKHQGANVSANSRENSVAL